MGDLDALLDRLADLVADRVAAKLANDNGAGHAEEPDKLLTVEEAAARLGTTRRWLYARKDLPFVVRLPGRAVRFSARGIERYIEQRAKQGR